MDKIAKALKKFNLEEKRKVKYILKKIKLGELEEFEVKKLKARNDIYRIRKGGIRVIFYKKDNRFKIITIGKRSDNTYKF